MLLDVAMSTDISDIILFLIPHLFKLKFFSSVEDWEKGKTLNMYRIFKNILRTFKILRMYGVEGFLSIRISLV